MDGPFARWELARPGRVRLAVTEVGDPALPAAVLGHGAGSSADFVLRCFGPALLEAGYRPVAFDLRGHGDSTPVHDPALLGVPVHAADLGAVATTVGASLVGGLSLGGHAAALVAAGRAGLHGLLVALPAWTGPPDPVAAANLAQADELALTGIPAALARIRELPEMPGWVADELADAWPRHDPAAFVAVLRALGVAAAPDEAVLRSVAAPAAVVSLAGDPLHPAAVARRWAGLLPRAVHAEVTHAEMAADRAALGRAALAALDEAAQTAPAG